MAGCCRTFDAAADGYGESEAIALGQVSTAFIPHYADLACSGGGGGGRGGRTGPLLALLHGSAVNQDGRSSSLTAPNGPAQTLLIRDALAAAAEPPHTVAAVSLHGTGTPLGDPIEVGALSAALAAGGGKRGGDGGGARLAGRAVALLSSKSCYGHTEGTAGVTGALLAAMSLQQRQRAPIVNLRGLNPYVAAALSDWRSRHNVAAAAGRQAGPAPHLASGAATGAPLLAGTSSFGMSGVNAHALLAATGGNLDAATLASARTRVSWQRAGYWPAPVPHPLLTRSAAQPGAAALECIADLAAARLAWLWDHSVRGRALLPGAAMFEAAAAAALALACSSTDGGVSPSLCPALAGLAILAPCVLPAAAGGGNDGGVALRGSVGRASGALEVSSGGGGGGGSGAVHLRAVAAALRAPPTLQPATASSTLGGVTAAAAAALLPLRCQLNVAIPGHNLAAVGASRQDTEG
jgi:acyl transferase domain-containing protein